MTAILPTVSTGEADETKREDGWQQRRFDVREGVAAGVLLVATAAMYLWNLSASGWANAFYSAAAQAGGTNWTAMLFGSSDAANAITVDKTPAALWVMDVSVRLFGLNPWSVLVPQALEGVAAVALLYAAVRRVSGPWAALLAGAIFALTPVAALMFRFNNPDALLVLMLVAAAYCVTRACETGSSRCGREERWGGWWLAAAGVAVGFGFLAKMAQAFLVLPGFGVAYLLAAHVPMWTRVRRSAGAAVALVVSSGWYLLLVEVWPASSRPYIGGSQHNSIIELALGYNGLGRITGNETGGLGNLNFDAGWGRLFGTGMGPYIGWLIPAAVVCIGAGLVLVRRAPRTDPTRAALIVWGGWLSVTAVVFSFANGILHQYYTVALAPAIAAGIGIGATALWRNRSDVRAAATMSVTVVVTVVLAAVMMSRQQEWLPWLRLAVAVGGVGAAALLVVVARLPRRVAIAAAGIAIAACVAVPGAYTLATVASPHGGAVPSVGPARGGGFGGFGGLFESPESGPDLTRLLAVDADHYTWAAAVVGSTNAAGYQLAVGAPVMALGGFNGTDPAPTLAQFKQLVAEGKIHYYIHAKVMFGGGGRSRLGTGSHDAADISEWVEAHYDPVRVDEVAICDLTVAPQNS
jgi:4-amino-4-deoxy-L-arabinose transferase-like glycosyltransferase